MLRNVCLIAVLLLSCLIGCAEQPPAAERQSAAERQPTPAPPLELPDLNGREREPLRSAQASATVLFFLGTECPISNYYSPEIRRICDTYRTRNVRFFIVLPDSGLSVADAKQHAADFGYDCPVLRDPNHELVRRVGATVTPQAIVLAPDGSLLYRGRIDDQYVALGRQRPAATRRDLRITLDAILAGRPVPRQFTRAVGCAIDLTVN